MMPDQPVAIFALSIVGALIAAPILFGLIYAHSMRRSERGYFTSAELAEFAMMMHLSPKDEEAMFTDNASRRAEWEKRR